MEVQHLTPLQTRPNPHHPPCLETHPPPPSRPSQASRSSASPPSWASPARPASIPTGTTPCLSSATAAFPAHGNPSHTSLTHSLVSSLFSTQVLRWVHESHVVWCVPEESSILHTEIPDTIPVSSTTDWQAAFGFSSSSTSSSHSNHVPHSSACSETHDDDLGEEYNLTIVTLVEM